MTKVGDILVWLESNLAVKGLKTGSRIGHLIKIGIVVSLGLRWA